MKKIVKLIVIVLIIVVFIIPYAKVEYLTYRYGKSFSDGYKQTNMIENIDYFKVLSYSSTKAEVYYISSSHGARDKMTFTKTDGEWIYCEWETVWSKYGSADSFIWPYYW